MAVTNPRELPRVTVFAEDSPQPQQAQYEQVYPQGIGPAIAEPLRTMGLQVHSAYLTQTDNGLSAAVLAETDVLIHWSHKAQHLVAMETTDRIHERVLGGMGLIVLHSSLVSEVFRRLMGTTMAKPARNIGERERLWTIDPAHPIAQGVGPFIELQEEEMYSECFDIPSPEELVFISWFEGGEVFRSGCCWRRGRGKIFYFRPGHETAPTYHQPLVQRILYNAALWAMPVGGVAAPRYHERVVITPEAPYNPKFRN